MAVGEERTFEATGDMAFATEIYFEGDKSVRLFADSATSRPVLDGGGETRFFRLFYGASLELEHIVLTNGRAGDTGGWSDGTLRGGVVLVYKSFLTLIDCVVRGGNADDYVRDSGIAALGLSHRGSWPRCFVMKLTSPLFWLLLWLRVGVGGGWGASGWRGVPLLIYRRVPSDLLLGQLRWGVPFCPALTDPKLLSSLPLASAASCICVSGYLTLDSFCFWPA